MDGRKVVRVEADTAIEEGGVETRLIDEVDEQLSSSRSTHTLSTKLHGFYVTVPVRLR